MSVLVFMPISRVLYNSYIYKSSTLTCYYAVTVYNRQITTHQITHKQHLLLLDRKEAICLSTSYGTQLCQNHICT